MRKIAALSAGLLLLTGCGSADVAARVGDVTITEDQVTAMTRIECARAGGAESGSPLRAVRAASLSQLMDIEVFRAVGRSTGGAFDREAYEAGLAELDQDIAKLPAKHREEAEELYAGYLEGFLQLREVAQRELVSAGQAEPDDAALQQAMQVVYAQTRQDLDVEVDDAYGPDENDIPGAGNGSLSVPVSDYAKQSVSQKPDPAFASSLPARLRCS